MAAVEASKSFITSVVLGKDVVPRIGLHQIDALRSDLMNAISHSNDPKVGNRRVFISTYRAVLSVTDNYKPKDCRDLLASVRRTLAFSNTIETIFID